MKFNKTKGLRANGVKLPGNQARKRGSFSPSIALFWRSRQPAVDDNRQERWEQKQEPAEYI